MSIQTIYNRFRSAGLSEAGALALLGNAQCESGCEPNRLQGDFSSGRTRSKNYTAAVDGGEKDRETFAKDQFGYGLFQWTWPGRKRNLYDYAKCWGASIGDEGMQCGFAMEELETEYANLLAFLKTTDDLYAATDRVCREYEQPAVNNVADRFKAAKKIGEMIDRGGTDAGSGAQAAAPVTSVTGSQGREEGDTPSTPYWPPRMLCLGMKGSDVAVAQALLLSRGWNVPGISGTYDNATAEAVVMFQNGQGLQGDAVIGPLTWSRLLTREGTA